MPKKKGAKKKGKKGGGDTAEKRTLIISEDMQEYAKIIKLLGDRRINVVLTDSSESLAVIPGRFRKRCWMKVGDVILVSRRDFQEGKLDVVYKYKDDEIRKLCKHGEIPNFFLDAGAIRGVDEDGGFIIGNVDSDEEAEDTKFDFEDI